MTLTFWFIAAAMTLFALVLIVRPLLRRTVAATGEQEKTMSVYRQQFAELEQDLSNGLLTDEQYRLARQELEHRLLDETGATETASVSGPQLISSRAVALTLALLLPVASGTLYWALGNPLALTPHPATAAVADQGGSDDERRMNEGLTDLAEQLKKKLEQNPNDGTGWALLARSYLAMGRHADAVPIFEKAVKLVPDDAQLLADYADTLGVHQGRKLEGKPDALIQKALKIDPRNVKALMLAGTVAFNRQDFARAAKDWEQARANLSTDAEPEAAQELTAAIMEAQRRQNGGKVMMAANNPHPAVPTSTQAKPAGAPAAGGKSRVISGTVTLSPGLAGKAASIQTLFVLAKDVSGPPMPVSVVKVSSKELPFKFRLDDSTSPMPTRKLSDVGPVVIIARLSKSGVAMPGSGDLEGMSQPIPAGAEGVSIVIDRERP
jgi:cytochrome c-type biogenesis protein CcmH